MGGGGGGALRSPQLASVNTHHVTLHTSPLLRLKSSIYVEHVSFGVEGRGGCNNLLRLRSYPVTSVNTFHVTLHKYFGEHFSCYVAHNSCASVNR